MALGAELLGAGALILMVRIRGAFLQCGRHSKGLGSGTGLKGIRHGKVAPDGRIGLGAFLVRHGLQLVFRVIVRNIRGIVQIKVLVRSQSQDLRGVGIHHDDTQIGAGVVGHEFLDRFLYDGLDRIVDGAHHRIAVGGLHCVPFSDAVVIDIAIGQAVYAHQFIVVVLLQAPVSAGRVPAGKAQDSPFTVTLQSLPDLLGVPVYRHDRPEQASTVGVCNGLAWTSAGGELLLVETSIMPGTGTIAATGKLGEVMQESAKAALTYVRSHSAELGLASDFYKQIDIHVHVPDGATPKDGPSAGITIVTAITSALLGIPVRSDVAMTGEISLRGRVLPIGGLQEKLLGAKRAGVATILIPKDNVRDLKEVPAEVLKGLDIVPVEHASEVLLKALDASEAEIFSGGGTLPLAKTLRADFPRPAQPSAGSTTPQ